MAAIDDLVNQIPDERLRGRIREELEKMGKRNKFGLVFENHLSECVFLYEYRITPGRLVARKSGPATELYKVLRIESDEALCLRRHTEEICRLPLADLVVVAEFGDPVYPCLEPIDSVRNAPDSDLWHILIEADNYHVLQLLDYLCHGKVDCIYIDPPYNTGAKDWKYNNDYVDSSDSYRHSKWLSMMEKRLKLAKRLLNPANSVMIVTIDEKEYLHLGCLLEQLFPQANMQMISAATNPKAVARDGFGRSDEYIFFIMFGESRPIRLALPQEWSASAIISAREQSGETGINVEPGWTSMMRRGTGSSRKDSPNLYYPIYADPKTKRIVKIGAAIPLNKNRAEEIPGLVQILPLRQNGEQGRWQVGNVELKKRIEQGRVRLGKPTAYGFVVNYLPDGEYAKIQRGEFAVQGRASDNSLIARNAEGNPIELRTPPTQWKIASHNASENGTTLLTSIIGEKRFTFPKSLYAVYDALRFFVADKPDALILDFFAGSGTTLHAVNLLNAEDGGRRRCIMATNNEVSADEAKSLAEQGYRPGDGEWEKLGIARYVTWPRAVCCIEGHDIKGKPLAGTYGISVDSYEPDDEVSLVSKTTGKPVKKTVYRKTARQLYPQLANILKSDGFKTNAAFFRLGFLDRTSVSLGEEFGRLIPLLWLKSGGKGVCPKVDPGEADREYYIFAKNGFAVLPDEQHFEHFRKELAARPEIGVAYLVTNDESSYHSMAKELGNVATTQLYRDYLDNFSINRGDRQ